MKRAPGVPLRLFLLFAFAAYWDLVRDADLHIPAAIVVVVLALQLGNRTAAVLTCPRCENACDHKAPTEDDPADEWGYHA